MSTVSPFTTASQTASPHNEYRLYDFTFWSVYLANFLLVTANALLFRFGDFVVFLGGTTGTAGKIVSFGMLGSVLLRLTMGRCIDRHGPKHVWMASALLFIVACLAFIPIQGLGLSVYIARLMMSVSLAGMFTCSFVFISAHAPVERRAELIGILGTSGLFGMIIGPNISDLLFRYMGTGHQTFSALFILSASIGCVYLVLSWFITRKANPVQPEKDGSTRQILTKYWPGSLMLVALTMGFAQTVPQTFLSLFVHRQGISGIGIFFLCYAITAFAVRVIGRRWPEHIGRENAVLIGLIATAVSMLLYLPAHSDLTIIAPAMAAGVAHAILFPCTISLGADSFPDRYRGTGMTLMLGMTELGIVFGGHSLGSIVDLWGFQVMFVCLAFIALSVSIVYAVSIRRHQPTETAPHQSSPSTVLPLPPVQTLKLSTVALKKQTHAERPSQTQLDPVTLTRNSSP